MTIRRSRHDRHQYGERKEESGGMLHGHVLLWRAHCAGPFVFFETTALSYASLAVLTHGVLGAGVAGPAQREAMYSRSHTARANVACWGRWPLSAWLALTAPFSAASWPGRGSPRRSRTRSRWRSWPRY